MSSACVCFQVYKEVGKLCLWLSLWFWAVGIWVTVQEGSWSLHCLAKSILTLPFKLLSFFISELFFSYLFFKTCVPWMFSSKPSCLSWFLRWLGGFPITWLHTVMAVTVRSGLLAGNTTAGNVCAMRDADELSSWHNLGEISVSFGLWLLS